MDMSLGLLYMVLRARLLLHEGLCEKDAIFKKNAGGFGVLH